MYLKVLAIVLLSLWWRPFCDCFDVERELKCEAANFELLPSPLEPTINLNVDHPEFPLNLTQVHDVLMNNDSKITMVRNDTEEDFVSCFKYPWFYKGNENEFGAIDANGDFYGTFTHLKEVHFVEPNKCANQSAHHYHVFRCSHDFSNETVNVCPRNLTEDEVWNKPVQRKPMWPEIIQVIVGDHARHSRGQAKKKPSKKEETVVCDLKIVADYPFFSRVANHSKDEALRIILTVMSKVDKIFRTSDFDQNGIEDNLRFFVSDVKVFLDPTEDEYNSSSEWNPTAFFTEFARYDFSGACAGLLFTYRNFPGNETYGPAVFKSTFNSTERGICSAPNMKFPKEKMENYGEFISNAVPLNFRWKEKPAVDFRQVAVQAAHQLAQLFGAPTDDDTVCRTQDVSRMNVMALPLPPGTHPENQRFSSCSKVAVVDYLRNLSRPCLRVCEGGNCVKRSMKFPVNESELFVKVVELPTVPTEKSAGASSKIDFSLAFFFLAFHLLCDYLNCLKKM